MAFPRYETGATQVLVPETYGDELADAPKPPGDLTTVQQLHFDYWTAFREYLEQRGSHIQLSKPSSTSIASSRLAPSGYAFRAWNRMNDGWSGVEASPKSPDAVATLELVDHQLVSERLSHFGEVKWRGHPGPPSVWVERDGKQEGMPTDREEWPKLMEWMARSLDELWSLFGSTGGQEPPPNARAGLRP